MKWLPFALLLLASPAAGEAWSHGCQFNSNGTGVRPTEFLINAANVACFRFVAADATVQSSLIVVQSETAVWCFDPDNTDSATDTSRVTIYHCPAGGVAGATTSASNTATCIRTGGANGQTYLSGREGAAAVQNACIRTGPGAFFIRASALCAQSSPNYCQVTVRGESSNQ